MNCLFLLGRLFLWYAYRWFENEFAKVSRLEPEQFDLFDKTIYCTHFARQKHLITFSVISMDLPLHLMGRKKNEWNFINSKPQKEWTNKYEKYRLLSHLSSMEIITKTRWVCVTVAALALHRRSRSSMIIVIVIVISSLVVFSLLAAQSLSYISFGICLH